MINRDFKNRASMEVYNKVGAIGRNSFRWSHRLSAKVGTIITQLFRAIHVKWPHEE